VNLRSTLLMAGAVVFCGTPATFAQRAPFELPKPTGTYPVGTTGWRLTDSSRPDPFSSSGTSRQVEVLAWYPAATPSPAQRAPYLREGLAEVRAFARGLGAETVFDGLEHVQTHAEVDADVAATRQKLPVLVFSHGYTGIPSAYTALLEDLASHGYAVLSVVHPYEASAATLVDGRVVTMLDDAGRPVAPVAEVFEEWKLEDETMSAVTRAAEGDEQLKLLRGYLSKIPRTEVALRRWVDDTKLVVDRLPGLERNSVAGRLAARLDLSRIGVFGHSMGGVTAAQFCVQDPRCRAGLNLDGIPQYGGMIDARLGRPFLMVYSARPGRLGASDPIYRRAAQPYLRVDVPGTRHLDFCDMTFWGGPLREHPIPGAIDPVRASAITRAVVRQYFDQELLKRRGALQAAMKAYPELTFRTMPAAGR
jgi:pimeloyl-ACP methyl ester carboxylesterase